MSVPAAPPCRDPHCQSGPACQSNPIATALHGIKAVTMVRTEPSPAACARCFRCAPRCQNTVSAQTFHSQAPSVALSQPSTHRWDRTRSSHGPSPIVSGHPLPHQSHRPNLPEALDAHALGASIAWGPRGSTSGRRAAVAHDWAWLGHRILLVGMGVCGVGGVP